MGGKSSPPPAPDYMGMAKQQGAANFLAAQQSGMLSNPNIISPTGSRTISYSKQYQSPEVDKSAFYKTENLPWGYQRNYFDQAAYDAAVADRESKALITPLIEEKLTPEAQKAFEAQQKVDRALSELGLSSVGRVQDVMGRGFQYGGPDIQTALNLSNAPEMPINAGMTGQEAIMKRLQPQIQQNRESLRQNLANQGITEGSEAWNRAMAEQQQGESDLYSQAALQGINADMAARSQAVNEAIQSGQFANTAAEQDFARKLGLYNLPLNQVSALLSGAQIQMPQFQGYSGQNIAAEPIFQAGQLTGQAAMDRYNAEVAQQNALTSGLFSLAGSGLGAYGMMHMPTK